MIVGGGLHHIQPSLSAYYHFAPDAAGQYGAGTMRDAFVGMLCAIGSFIFFYRGHSFQEAVALNCACISAVLDTMVPTDWPAIKGAATSLPEKFHWFFTTTCSLVICYV